jgi:hypothetical protein
MELVNNNINQYDAGHLPQAPNAPGYRPFGFGQKRLEMLQYNM